MRRPVLALVLLSLALPGAREVRADTIFVGTREIHGEIEDENDERVVIKVATGKLEIPRKQITKIVREGELETLLGEARSLATLLDPKALSVYARAIEAAKNAGNDSGAEAAQKERDGFAERLKKQAARVAPPAPPPPKTVKDDLFLLEKDEDEVSVLEKAYKEGSKVSGHNAAVTLVELAKRHHVDGEDRWAVGCLVLARALDPEDAKALFDGELYERMLACGEAIRARDAKVAVAAIEPVAAEKPRDPHVGYLDGRAHEIAKKLDLAEAAYKRALQGVDVPNLGELSVDWLRELARRRAAGHELVPGSPGFGAQWRETHSDHFVVFHELGDGFKDDEVQAFEKARSESLQRLGFGDQDIARLDKLPLYIFKDHDSYVGAGGMEWAGGHATGDILEDGRSPSVYTYPGRRLATDTMQHELAHVFVSEVLPDLILPMWATEGVACYAETDRSRTGRNMQAARESAAGTLTPLAEFLAHVTVDQKDNASIVRFYAESTVVFTLLATKTGGTKDALKLAGKIARKGADAALKEIGTDTATLEAELKTNLAGGN